MIEKVIWLRFNPLGSTCSDTFGIEKERYMEIYGMVERVMDECTRETDEVRTVNHTEIIQRLTETFDDNELIVALMIHQFIRGAEYAQDRILERFVEILDELETREEG